ncbi:MAG: hypothetical protein ACTSPI_15370, partial [Candidatus Heimdallarchaeaceae archaeon]
MYVPKRKRMFDKKELVQNIALGSVVIGGLIITYIFGGMFFKLLAYIVVAILVTIFIFGFIIRFLTGRGYAIASAINEMLYIFVAIPIIVMAATYLPISIYLTFFGTEWKDYILFVIFAITVLMMITSVLYL